MSNEPTIEQMNEAIALFMGLKPVPCGTKRLGDIKHPEISEAFLKYHSSWDCLHDVIEKIRKGVSYREFEMDYELFEENTEASSIFHLRLYASIETVHNAVYQFIQWYNKQQSND